jgi:DNA-binding response OmpR family regulator
MRRVLVIDDEPYVREALQRVLKAPEFIVEAAADADLGMARLDKEPADLVIIDVVLPGMNGVEAIARIRAAHPRVRIIAISGGGNFGLTEYQPEAIATCAYLAAARDAGADAVLAKPFETQELRALMSETLRIS